VKETVADDVDEMENMIGIGDEMEHDLNVHK
jgi:hypothetical protein